MNLPVRPSRTEVNLHPQAHGGRETRIRQEGSQFGPTQVSGGIALQGNFAGGVTISELPYVVSAIPFADGVQMLPHGLISSDSTRIQRSNR